MKELSIIVPIYNSENTLERCLESILSQTYQNFELICVNDGSRDTSASILSRYSKKDSRILIINKANGGLSSARNAGIEIASGKFIGFVDADDYVEPNLFEVLVTQMTNLQCQLVGCGTNVIYEDWSALKGDDELSFKVKLGNKEKVSSGMMKKMDTHVWNKIFLKKIIDRYNLRFPVGYWYEDVPFVWSYVAVSETVSFTNQKLYNYIRSSNTIMGATYQGNNLKALDHLKVLDLVYDFLLEHHKLNILKKDFYDLVISHILKTNRYLSFKHKFEILKEVFKLFKKIGLKHTFLILERFVLKAGLKSFKALGLK